MSAVLALRDAAVGVEEYRCDNDGDNGDGKSQSI
jgi:hypothetical protein